LAAIEYNPSEAGSDEIAVLTASATATFVIPVNPVADTDLRNVTLSTPLVRGIEDEALSLGSIEFQGIPVADEDGSETAFIEIDTTEAPPGSIFSVNGTQQTVTGSLLVVSESDSSKISIETPEDYSGAFNLTVFVRITDVATDGDTATGVSEPMALEVIIDPVADGVACATNDVSVGNEDHEPIPFGNVIASSIDLIDDGEISAGNNAETETISKITVWLPADTGDLVYTISGFSINGSATFEYNATTRTYVISSTILTAAEDTPSLPLENRQTAQDDILAVLRSFKVEMGPDHTDANGSIEYSVTTLDVNEGVSNEVDTSCTHKVIVRAVADPPGVSVENPTKVVKEDGENIPLNITATRSPDGDGSESLSVRITVPEDGTGQPVGIITGTPPSGVNMVDKGGGVYIITAPEDSPEAEEMLLNSFIQGGIKFDPRDHWSGVLTGEEGIKVEAISTEFENGEELAPNNSTDEGTFGDRFTKNETAVDYIEVVVEPVVDIEYLDDSVLMVGLESSFRENNGTIDDSQELVVRLGQNLGLSTADKDGSERMQVEFSGFPTNTAITVSGNIPNGVNVSIDEVNGVVLLEGDNSTKVIQAMDALEVELPWPTDDDANFNVTIQGNITDSNGETKDSESFTVIHQVQVRAVADIPNVVVVGQTPKAAVDENSTYVTYPVNVSLNDVDGSEKYESVVISYSTPGDGNDPVISLGTSDGVTTTPNATAGEIVMTGSTTDIETALKTLQIRPGDGNGEDITVTVTATAIEYNPSEAGSDEIAVLTASATATFVIPVNPVVDRPTISQSNSSFRGIEDEPLSLGTLAIGGLSDPDGSEGGFIEVDMVSTPPGSIFYVDGIQQNGTQIGNRLRLPASESSVISIGTPDHFSGAFNLTVRGVIVDVTSDGDSATGISDPITLEVIIDPMADGVTCATVSVGNEDYEPIPFGNDIASSIDLIDDGLSEGNNAETETISKITVRVPADTEYLVYTISGFSNGSATFEYNAQR
jgi:hypothetical protein